MPRTESVNQQIREQQRENIHSAAKRVFVRKGSATTMADIAAEAQVSQGLAYRYFESKEEIFKTLVKDSIQSADDYEEMMRKIPGTPAEKLRTIVTRLLERRREQSGYYQLLYQMLSDGSLPLELRERMGRHGKTLFKGLRQLIVDGQSSGEIAKDDPDQLLEAVMACIEGLWKRMAYSDNPSASYPDPKIVLRMLRPDREIEPSVKRK